LFSSVKIASDEVKYRGAVEGLDAQVVQQRRSFACFLASEAANTFIVNRAVVDPGAAFVLFEGVGDQ
jgi:hypothetical protein